MGYTLVQPSSALTSSVGLESGASIPQMCSREMKLGCGGHEGPLLAQFCPTAKDAAGPRRPHDCVGYQHLNGTVDATNRRKIHVLA